MKGVWVKSVGVAIVFYNSLENGRFGRFVCKNAADKDYNVHRHDSVQQPSRATPTIEVVKDVSRLCAQRTH